MMKHSFKLFVGLLVCSCTQLAAQIITGSIGGTVTDATGAAIPDAKATVSSSALIGGAKTTVSDAAGAYKFLELPPGTYTVHFEKTGFKAFTAQGVVLNTGVTVTTDARLDLGEVSQEVTVEAAAAAIDTAHVTSQRVASQ